MNFEILNERGPFEKALEASRLCQPSPSPRNIQRQPIPKLIQTANLGSSAHHRDHSSRRKEKRSTASKCTLILLLLIFPLTLGFVIGACFNYFYEFEYERVFKDKIEISSAYIPDTLLHSVKVNFKNKHLKLEHRVVPKRQHEDNSFSHTHKHDKEHMHKHQRSENILMRINRYLRNALHSLDHLLDYKSKEDQEIRIFVY